MLLEFTKQSHFGHLKCEWNWPKMSHFYVQKVASTISLRFEFSRQKWLDSNADFWRENSNMCNSKLNVARFARNVIKWDFLSDFQPLHTIRKVKFLSKNSILTETPTFSPKTFLTIFLVKSKLSTAKKSQTTTFSRVFHPKEFDIFSREIKVEFLDKKWRFRTVWGGKSTKGIYIYNGVDMNSNVPGFFLVKVSISVSTIEGITGKGL